MAQFDVFLNTERRRNQIAFFVSLQNTRYEDELSRFVAPLFPAILLTARPSWIAPRFIVLGQGVVLDVQNLATLSIKRLGPPIATLADEASRTKLVRALDEFLSQA